MNAAGPSKKRKASISGTEAEPASDAEAHAERKKLKTTQVGTPRRGQKVVEAPSEESFAEPGKGKEKVKEEVVDDEELLLASGDDLPREREQDSDAPFDSGAETARA